MLKTTKLIETKETFSFITKGNAYDLPPKKEQFAQRMAIGDRLAEDIYAEVFGLDPETEQDHKKIKTLASHLLTDTTVVLRIQQLKRPIIRKLRAKIEYTIQHALEECTVAYDLAYEAGDVKAMLKAIEMKAQLSKLLTQDIKVTHLHGALDNEETAVLLGLRDEVRVRMEKEKRLRQIRGEIGETIEATPHRPLSSEGEGTPG